MNSTRKPYEVIDPADTRRQLITLREANYIANDEFKRRHHFNKGIITYLNYLSIIRFYKNFESKNYLLAVWIEEKYDTFKQLTDFLGEQELTKTAEASVMAENNLLADGEVREVIFLTPEKPVWTWTLCNASDVSFNVVKAPNWFHRLMQRVCLGIRWERLS